MPKKAYDGVEQMGMMRLIAIGFVVLGALGLAYGSFSYTKSSDKGTIGPLQISVKQKETINIPIWAGVGAIVIGGVFLLVGGRKE